MGYPDSSPDQYDLVVIGGGSAGLTAARFAAKLGRKAAIIEANRLGGDCTWTGCVPSKSLIRAARAAHEIRDAYRFGISASLSPIDFSQVMGRIRSVIEEIYQAESSEVLRGEGIDVFLEPARLAGPHTVLAGDNLVRFKKLLICTGARPLIPPIPGLNETDFLTYEDLWDLDDLPKRLVVIGGGPIGCELAQALGRLGSKITLVEGTQRLLGQDEPEASDVIAKALTRDGVDVALGAPVTSVSQAGDPVLVTSDSREWSADRLLVATGRQANTEGLDLAKADVATCSRGIKVNRYLQTSQPHIYAAGDCIDGPQFTHYAGWQGFMAARNALLPGRSQAIRDNVPWATFTDPEVAKVGLSEAEARNKFGDAIETVLWPADRTDRPIIDGAVDGFTKIVTLKNGELLGATIAGPRAGEAIHELALAIERGLKLGDLASTLHIYPTYSMVAMQMAADDRVSRLLSGLSGKLVRLLTRRRRLW